MSEDFVRRLRERVDASVPEIPVETALVVPRARRRRALMRSVSALAVVAVIGGSVWTAGAFRPGRTTNGPAGVETPSPVPADQRAGLFGVWKVTADGEGAYTYLKLDGQQADVWRDCGFVTGPWAVGPTRFVGEVSGWSTSCPQKLPWLENAAYYRANGDGWQLLDMSGAVVATLWHDGVPTSRPGVSEVSSDLAQPPVVDDAMRAWVSDPAPLPAGVIPVSADLIAGRWRAAGAPVANDPYVEFLADGRWNGSDGCNDTGGRWAADLDGRLVVVGGGSTLVLCDGAPLSSTLVSARRAAFSDSGDLLLFDNEGMQVAQLTRDGPAKETAEPTTTPSAGDPIRTALPTLPATLTVTCGAGTLVSESGPSPVVATSAGVRMVVQNDGAPAGTRLHIPITGGGWVEQELPTTPTEWVLTLPPGPIHLSCWTRGTTVTTWGDLTLTVADPGGFYRSTTLDDLGCGGASAYLDGGRVFLDDVAPQNDHWVTARQAVEAWFSVLPDPATLTAEQAPMGYPDAPVQTWLLLRDGKPYLWLTAWDAGGGFTTAAGSACPAA